MRKYLLPWKFSFFLAVCAVLPGNAHAQNARSPWANYEDQFQTEKISRNGFDLYYRSLGKGEPVLILGGGPGDDCDYLLPVASEIAKYAHAILLEQRGTGRSLPSHVDKNTVNLALYLEDSEVLRTHLKVKRWTVVGHSAGGLLAMYYAAAYPERIHKLVLLDSVPVASQFLGAFQDNILDRLSTEDREQLASLETSNSPENQMAVAQLQAKGLFFNRKIGEQLAGELSSAWHADVGRLLGAEITAPGYDLRPRLRNFHHPVLVLNGRQDPMDPWMAYETSTAFRHSTLKFTNRAGHFPWFEQPNDFHETLRFFLESK